MRNSTKYILVAAITLFTAVVAVKLCLPGNPAPEEIMEQECPKPVPLNHLLCNSMSDYPHTSRFDSAILRFMRYWGIRGGSFALMRNDSLLYAKGYGYANTTDSTLCEVKNIFRLASVSKLLTAVAIMHLEETGQSPHRILYLVRKGFFAIHFFLK